ncbi:hypothetical protein KDA_31420 [Dictyobacter alpinus]|uniref:Uncharacterized protein n=1 Tax=Dictyobacter alpinus TaxID=2014873 RepID=A0A402B8H9_9CHLR|nr:hypothetical protein [Dictyobacter alpinus]GCE27658.1 hypothetical protein KDA_31420 [Dictyobacter alpinus]
MYSFYVLLARAAAAAKAVTYAEYVEITEGAAVTVANLLPSVATAFITTCAGGFTLFFYKDLANKLFPDRPTSDANGAAYANELSQNLSVACSSGSPDDSSGLCYDGGQDRTPGGTALGGTICGAVSPGASFDSVSGLCIGDDGSYSQPDGTNMGSCIIGFPTGRGNCITGDNNLYDPPGNPGGNANTAPDESCVNYLANGNANPCFQGFVLLDPSVTPTPPDTSDIWCVARSGVDWANWKYYQPSANFFGGIARYPVYCGIHPMDGSYFSSRYMLDMLLQNRNFSLLIR